VVHFIATLARPVIWLLGVSTSVAVRVLGGDPNIRREDGTVEEIRALISGSPTLGEENAESSRESLTRIRCASVRVIVAPHRRHFLSSSVPVRLAADEVLEAPHSRYPVIASSADDIIGFVHIRDLLNSRVIDSTAPIRDLARPTREEAVEQLPKHRLAFGEFPAGAGFLTEIAA
jgi:putative hemolysin